MGKKKDGKLSVVQTLLSLFNFASIYWKNDKLVNSYLEKTKVGAVVTDSEYIFRPIQKRKIPIIALNNSDMVMASFFKLDNKPFSIYAQFIFVEFFDFLYHLFVPDKVVSPRLTDFSSIGKKFIPVGPIVRKRYLPSNPRSEVRNVVIMLSGSAFGSQVNLTGKKFPYKIDVIGREGKSENTLNFHGKLLNNFELVYDADILVINAGFSAVSEALFMRKPSIVIPVENHAEQFINARNFEKLGYGFSSNSGDLEYSLNRLSKEIEKYNSQIRNCEPLENGSEKAFRVLMEYL